MGTIQPKMIRIREMLDVQPFRIVCRWSNGDIRVNDFTHEVVRWQKSRNQALAQLADPEKFRTAFAQSGTIAFGGILVDMDTIGLQPLDLDPDVLFEESMKAGQFSDVSVHKSY